MGISISETEYRKICDEIVEKTNKASTPWDAITNDDLAEAGLYSYIIACMNTAYDFRMDKDAKEDLIHGVCMQVGLAVLKYKYEAYLKSTPKERFNQYAISLFKKGSVSDEEFEEMKRLFYAAEDDKPDCHDEDKDYDKDEALYQWALEQKKIEHLD